MRPILFSAIIVLLAGCASPADRDDTPVVMVVDSKGAPIAGALVTPELDNSSASRPAVISPDDRARMTSDAQGVIHPDLDDYYWPNDHCYHFIATRKGYLDATLTISKDLFPSPLKLRMDAVGEPAAPKAAPDAPLGASK